MKKTLLAIILSVYSFTSIALKNISDDTEDNTPIIEDNVSDDLASNKSIFDASDEINDAINADEKNDESVLGTVVSEEKMSDKKFALIHVVDKELGKLYKLDIPIGGKDKVNEITIFVKKCIGPSDISFISEGRVQIDVLESKSLHLQKIFSGWIYSQSPSASHIKHNKYSIMLHSCK